MIAITLNFQRPEETIFMVFSAERSTFLRIATALEADLWCSDVVHNGAWRHSAHLRGENRIGPPRSFVLRKQLRTWADEFEALMINCPMTLPESPFRFCPVPDSAFGASKEAHGRVPGWMWEPELTSSLP
jgi:hypothetical protein